MKMAKSYTHEHINKDGNYEIHVNEDFENIGTARIQSRHVSAKKFYNDTVKAGVLQMQNRISRVRMLCPYNQRYLVPFVCEISGDTCA